MNEKRYFNKFDAAIIGAGNGGLVAATQLALEGKKIILFEQHNLPGGFATSFVRGRFEFEATLHELCNYGPSNDKGDIRKLFEDDLGLNIEFVEIPEAFRLISTDPKDNLDVVVPFGIEKFVKTVEESVPGSENAIRKYIRLSEEINGAISYLVESQGNPDKDVLVKQYKNFLKSVPYSLDEVNNALKVPEKAQKILNGYWCYIGIPTNRINFTFYAAMHYYFLIRKAYFPKLLSNAIATALESRIRELGGIIQYNSKVNRILVENGKIIGVKTDQGDEIMTNRVISNASPTLTYNNLIAQESVPDIAFKYVNARKHATSCFTVYLGLNSSPKDLGINNYSYHIFENMNTEQIYNSFKTLNSPMAQATTCLNNIIRDCSPPNTTILMITSFFLPGAWDMVLPTEYFKFKTRIAEDLITSFEKALQISIKDHIEEIEIATPQTLTRFTGAYNGSAYGYESDPWDSFIPRLIAMNDEKYVNGLEFCGGYSAQGVSYTNSLLSGQIAAFLTLRELNISEGEQ
jgi:phytoene dehydrogenase-like protein